LTQHFYSFDSFVVHLPKQLGLGVREDGRSLCNCKKNTGHNIRKVDLRDAICLPPFTGP
jgi:hypothetical protein